MQAKTKKKKKNFFTKKPKPYKIEIETKTNKHKATIFLFNEFKENKKYDLKQITFLGFGILNRYPEFVNLRVNLLSFELIMTYEKKDKAQEPKKKLFEK